MFQTKVVEKINTFLFSACLPEYRDVYVTMWKNVVQPNKHGASASQATHAQILALPQQQWLNERTSLLLLYEYRMYFFFTFVGPCIVICFYSKTNQMHNINNLFYFGTIFYMFRAVSPSIIKSLRLHTASGTCHAGSVAAYYQAATEPV
jgi:hypothetical protein